MGIYKDERYKKQWYFSCQNGFTIIDGKKKYKKYTSKRFNTKRECEKAYAEFKLKESHAMNTAKPVDILCDEFLYEYKNTVKIQTYQKTETCLRFAKAFFGDMLVTKINDEVYREFREYLKEYTYKKKDDYKHLEVDQLNKINCYFKKVLAYSFEEYGVTYKVPSKFQTFPKVAQKPSIEVFYELEDIKKLLANTESIQYRNLFTVLSFLGLREGEANALTFESIKGDMLVVNKSVTTKIRDKDGNYLISSPKTKKSNRTLLMPNIVKKSIEEMKLHWQQFDGFNDQWFIFGGLTPLPESTMSKRFAEAYKKAGLKPARLHSLRKSCASLLYNNGVSPLVVQEILGHEDIQTTLKIYTQVYKNKTAEAVDFINNVV